jgi:hypothetical protein
MSTNKETSNGGNSGFWDFIKYPFLIVLICYLVFCQNPILTKQDQQEIKVWITAFVNKYSSK